MTVEKAIEILSDVGDINRCCAEDAEALDMAIKALEQQICDNDCEHCDWVTCPKMEEETETITVSKGCLKVRKGRFVVYDVEYLKSHIEQEAAIYGNVSAITGKTEDRPTGRWEWVQYDANPEIGNFHCSECRYIPASFNMSAKNLNYCPNCGAKMEGEDDRD